ncbi:MAG: sigma-70 family RNA polymerase sigma factor [Candidatus Dormibacteraeota bacterium]|nr:sigma-70 family RNA polymerase sigma factor [Candidatus Dormibacteraeota bacterium]
MVQDESTGQILPLPPEGRSAVEIALDELEHVYAFVYRHVGNRADAEDLVQEVALKAVPRLRPEASAASVRGYLFAIARTELARFWGRRFALPEEILREDLIWDEGDDGDREAYAIRMVKRVLSRLPARYARVLELRFLHGYSAAEIADELGSTAGAVRVTQLRALRAAARVHLDD